MTLRRDFKVLVHGKIDGSVSRVVILSDGLGRIETWKPGEGWKEGGASLDEFLPGPSCLPVSVETIARFGIPAEELAVHALGNK